MILFHRSPIEVIQDGYIGYGWKQLNFSEYQTINDLLKVFQEKYPECNSHRNMIRRFFNLKLGDIVIATSNDTWDNSIFIGKVIGKKRYVSSIAYGANQVEVDFYKNNNGDLLKISRNELSNALQSKLRMPRTNVEIYNKELIDEINAIINKIENNGEYKRVSVILEKRDLAIIELKRNLLSNIQDGHNGLQAGGEGFEDLILELLELDGYSAKKQAKNQSSDISDVDIIAEKNERFFSYKLFVQAKHHHGETGDYGIKQLIARENREENEIVQRLLITSADKVSKSAEDLANLENVNICTGNELVDWIYDSLPKLSQSTKEKLGIFESYQLIG